MIDIEQALGLVLERARPRTAESCTLCRAPERVLAEDIVSDADSPPYDKALMDGYAVIASDLRGGQAELVVLEEVTAGELPTERVRPRTAVRLMTGTPIPRGADAVVPMEAAELDESGDFPLVRIRDPQVRPGQHILYRGMSLRRGDMVLRRGRRLTEIDIGLLAEIGRTEIPVYPQPGVAVLATGSELVPACVEPGPGRIRNSNGPMLCAAVTKAGGRAVDLGIAPDHEWDLLQHITAGLQEDVLLLSGGVSAGVKDLVPRVLRDLGAEQVFHKVRLKPGKPLWFGCVPHAKGPRLVFGLPGNPVSTLVCFQLFVRPALAVMAGLPPAEMPHIDGELIAAYEQRGDRPTYFPARLRQDRGRVCVDLLDWRGSADLRTLAQADGLAVFPAGRSRYDAGQRVCVLLL